jgi:hypothetical protein
MNPNPNCYGVAGELPPVILISSGAPNLVSVSVSVWTPRPPNPLLHTQLELEARVGIGLVGALSAISNAHPQCLRHQRHAASKLSNTPIVRHFRRFVKPFYYASTNHQVLRYYSAKTRALALSLALFAAFLLVSTRRGSVRNIRLQGSHFVSKDSQDADHFIRVHWYQ